MLHGRRNVGMMIANVKEEGMGRKRSRNYKIFPRGNRY
jgi:hypothetical protein